MTVTLAQRLAAVTSRWILSGPWIRWTVFFGGAVVTGAVAVAFARASDWALKMCLAGAHDSPPWLWVAPPVGLTLAAWLTRRHFPGAQGSGIPQTIAALAIEDHDARGHLLSIRIAIGKFLITVLGLASGASVGREGPTVQIGASIMHSLGRIVRFAPADMERGLILAGGAAGVAAAFNTPLAGIVFAIEELARSLEERSSGTILTAVILAGVTSVALVGNYTYFGITHSVLGGPSTWLIVPICGVAGGICGGLFAHAMLATRQRLPTALRALGTSSPVPIALVCGLLIAVLGWASGGATLGTGYVEAKALVQQEMIPNYWYAPAKALATLASYATEIPAGIFAPSLAIGAGIGGAIDKFIHLAPAGATVVLAMAAYFAGVVQAPLTALVIVGEMTGDRALTLPLMGAVLIGRGSSALVCKESLYRALSLSFLASRPTPERDTTRRD